MKKKKKKTTNQPTNQPTNLPTNQSQSKWSDGAVVTDLKLVANKFNDFFVNVGPNLAREILK